MPVPLTRQIYLAAPMMRGDDVLMLQRRLAGLGEALAQDGLYGVGTRDAVRRFQAEQHLPDDGIVGSATWGALFPGGSGAQADKGAVGLGALAEAHGYFKDGCTWRMTQAGLEVIGQGLQAPSPAEIRLAATVLDQFRGPLLAAVSRHGVPVENVLACICTESSGNPSPAVRLEPGCDRQDPSRTPARCSHGLMQTLLSTARAVLGNPALPLEALGQPEVSIMAGTAYMAQQALHTRHDPPLAAAAYNAGSLRYDPTPANRWRLVQYPIGTPRHVDRFVRFFGAAMTATGAGSLPGDVPSFRGFRGTLRKPSSSEVGFRA